MFTHEADEQFSATSKYKARLLEQVTITIHALNILKSLP